MSDSVLPDKSEVSEKNERKHGRSLTEGPVLEHLLHLSIPMVWGILLIIAIQLIDMFYIGLLGDDALAAISFTFPVTYAIFAIFMGFGVAMSSVVSRLIGAGNVVEMHRVLFHGFILVSAFGAFFSFLGFYYAEPVFRAMGASGDVLKGTLDYMYIWFAGAVFVSLPMIGNSAMRACGNSRIPAVVMGTSALVNLVLDPILIFGWFGLPAMGMKGAAAATIISYVAGLLIGLYVMTFRMKILVNPAEFGWLKNFMDSSKRLIVIAVPAGITSAVQPLLNAIITALLAGVGAHAVAAYGIVTRVEAFLFVPIMGLATGMSPIIGQNFGAGQKDRVKEVLSYALKLAALWSFIVAVVLLVFKTQIAGLFTQDTQIIELTGIYFLVVPFSYILGNLVSGWSSAFNALAKPQLSFLILMMRMVVLSVPACWLGAQMAGAMGIFIAMAAVNIVSGFGTQLLSWRYISRC